MTANAQVNWTDAQTVDLVNAYATDKDLDALAARFSRSKRSIIAKLVTEKVYVKPEAPTPSPRTKGQIILEIEQLLNLEAQTLSTLEKGSKEALQALYQSVRTLTT